MTHRPPAPCRIPCAALAAVALALATAAPAAAQDRFGAQVRYWDFTNDQTMRDFVLYYSQPLVHAQLELWDFERGQDQFRPEVGLHLRDRRRSVYTIQWRHEDTRERLTFGTDQVLGGPWVARAEVSPLVGKGLEPLVVLSAGADYYWGSYNFASATAIRDPRDDGFWVFPLRVRLANESNDWLQAVVAPAAERTFGWALDAKLRWLRLGVERNSRFDFTEVDNVIYTIGFELETPRPE